MTITDKIIELETQLKLKEEQYPARVKFRGFSDKDVSESYEKITQYLKETIEELDKEVKE